MRELAYPIRKLGARLLRPGGVHCHGGVVRELERTLKIADEILRFVSVATVTTKPKERPARARRKSERRRRRRGAPAR